MYKINDYMTIHHDDGYIKTREQYMLCCSLEEAIHGMKCHLNNFIEYTFKCDIVDYSVHEGPYENSIMFYAEESDGTHYMNCLRIEFIKHYGIEGA